jgi:hypothetical protein
LSKFLNSKTIPIEGANVNCYVHYGSLGPIYNILGDYQPLWTLSTVFIFNILQGNVCLIRPGEKTPIISKYIADTLD